MRREELYLTDMVEAAKAVGAFTSGITFEWFLDNDQLKSAVLYKLTIIGEAASKIPKELKSKYPAIEWAKIAAFRNYVVHAYFSVDWVIVWGAAKEEVPELMEDIGRILKAEFSS